jgi:hypothetical protein
MQALRDRAERFEAAITCVPATGVCCQRACRLGLLRGVDDRAGDAVRQVFEQALVKPARGEANRYIGVLA